MISVYYRKIKDKGLQRLKIFKPGAWIDIVSPTPQDIKFLKRFKIDPSFVEDALDPDELPRIEKEGGKVYVILNVPQVEQGKMLNLPFLVVVGRDIFLTLSQKSLELIRSSLFHPGAYTTQKTKNLLNICFNLTALYTREVRRINKEITARKVSLSELKNEDIIAFVELEEILNNFIPSIVALIGVFEKIRTGKYLRVFSEDEQLLEDLIIDAHQILDMSRTSIKKIINIREAYSTILSNTLNKVVKFLTSLTIIMAIPTIIASIYGMNVALPLQNSPLAFFYILIFTFIVSLAFVLVFYLKKWL